MNIVLVGPPGCGKGTQGAILADRSGVRRVATGDLLRDAVRRGTDLGTQAKSYMDSGKLVPDEVILGLIREVLESDDAASGVIMDGFPRTTPQAVAVDKLLAERDQVVDHVLSFEVDDEELVTRMAGRAAQEGRSDDTPDAFRKRLAVFREQTAPLVAYYKDRGVVRPIDGMGGVEDVSRRINEAIAL